MMASGVGPIGAKAASCKQKFQAACKTASTSSAPQQACLLEGFDAKNLTDSYDRFNVWISSLGVLQKGRASLDFRISHDNLATEALRLLGQLEFFVSERQLIRPCILLIYL